MEGNVASAGDLLSAGHVGDNITPHHIPSANHMAQHGIPRNDGVSINMEQPHKGGRHRDTFTYGNRADSAMTPRDALAAGASDVRRIYSEQGLYNPWLRGQLRMQIELNKARHPELFTK